MVADGVRVVLFIILGLMALIPLTWLTFLFLDFCKEVAVQIYYWLRGW